MRRRQGFTLTELMMAVTITTLIGLVVASVASALSYAHSSTANMNGLVQSGRTALLNVDRSLRMGKLVVSATSNGLIIWKGDANGDKLMGMDEMARIELDTASRMVTETALSGMSSAGSTASALGLDQLLDFASASNLLNGAGYAAYRSNKVLATDVQDFQVVPNAPAPYASLVLLRLTTAKDGQRITLTDSAHLRAGALEYVSVVNSLPVLKLP
jgi:Tfp pilus assembly protein FimT